MFKSSILTTLLVFVICGFVYPILTTAVGQTCFHYQANGSLIKDNGKIVGSERIGQDFTSPYYLHGRPSPHHYSSYPVTDNPDHIQPVTGGTNLSNQNQTLLDRVAKDRKIFSQNNGVQPNDVPVNILTASGSGLDSQITKQAANMQIHRIAKHSGLSITTIQSIIDNHTLHQSESDIVNVLAVNLDIKHAMHR
ncbi:K(+)-transporting ATPase subunit C [Staphylococcus hyicus]|uniref:K(+)-transporting ATPase subunit C n=1 Tax=Staphylococcus hyicus TaxID=1284 RepID=UPI00057CC404|nr:K(+)-transporting ATPase subunit C [Staphylococcus hyicus]AJC94893.1 potassium-transporting ATPase subunit C [Staphylococcus hyicus]MCQ9291588.1 K(+)-transporting ATPase subunit C [Staphylococcus hyicus]MCQ9306829.1 K(+)-transporting ATPase subunit C [Staphylococcus hyicus]MCQ9309532.1 K(+)-transporting ATPase subunit C [Staphylococcus hyicus]MCQ9311663.1 K(+)-transporting ATPase subunit C [Staphylococcus hyicus]